MAKEQTIKQKETAMRQTSLLGGILLSIALGYYALMVCAYQYDYPRVDLFEAMSGALTKITEDPLYFWPITYDLGIFISVIILCPACSYMVYTINRLRIHHDLNTIKGKTKWADLSELVKRYADFEGKQYKKAYNNAILSENMQMSINQKKHFKALNTLILGATGSGKSRYFLKPNLLQLNTSYVITDPSGGILMETGEALRRFGYNVKVFDLVKMGECDTYNPLKYCYQESDIKKIVQAFMKNTDPTGGKSNQDPFWDNAMNAFMCACIGFLTQRPEGEDIPYAQIPEITGGLSYEPCFANLCELTRMANKRYDERVCNIRPLEGVKLGDGKSNTANASELAMIFENIRAYECRRQECGPEELIKPYCLREWENFRIAPEKTSTTILMTAAVRLDPFNIEQVKDLTSDDTLDLNNFGNQRDALFVITPTNDRTYNFLVSFLYTQLFDILYKNGETKSAGSKDLKLPNGELVRHFSVEDVQDGKPDEYLEKIKSPRIEKETNRGVLKGEKKIKTGFGPFKKEKAVSVKYDDSWYNIYDSDNNLITRRPTENLANAYIAELKKAKLIPGNGASVPTHVRFLLDEFPNLGEIPEFKEKLATMRKYEISCTVICQSITQLKGMYPDDYEVIDANCPQTIFLGGDENSNNEYISKKIGESTKKSMSNSIDKQKVSGSYQTEGGALMRPEDLGRIPFSDEIVLIYGEDPIYDKKYDYVNHKNYKYTHDYACDIKVKEGCIFERNGFVVRTKGNPIHKYERATAIPTIQKLETPEDFRKKFEALFGTNSTDIVEERAKNAYKRFSFENASVAAEC